MKKFIAKKYWHTLKIMIDKSEIIIGLSVFIIALLVFYIIENKTTDFWGISIKSWSAVFGSLLAASAFLLVQFVIRITKKTKRNVSEEQYEHLCEEQGVKTVYEQRGSTEIIDLYKSLIEKSTRRIWAIGMTNRHFCDQHFNVILPKVKSKGFECIISFWDPNVKMIGSDFEENIFGMQEIVEKNKNKGSNYLDTIEERVRNLIHEIEQHKSLKGSIKLLYTCTPTNITCFVIDDDVFFFPFLSNPESTNSPTIHCDATIGIGHQILAHFESVFENVKITKIRYVNNKK